MPEGPGNSAPWTGGTLPANVSAGEGTTITGDNAFKRCNSKLQPGLVIGAHSTMENVQFSLGPDARMTIGDYCSFSSVVLLCELDIRIGSYVVVGWNTTIGDSDFHPIDPALRIQDAIACSPTGKGRPRPPINRQPIVIEDDVWIGPQVTIFKGVRIGAGAWIEPGSVVTRDVPPGTRVGGNPACVISPVSP